MGALLAHKWRSNGAQMAHKWRINGTLMPLKTSWRGQVLIMAVPAVWWQRGIEDIGCCRFFLQRGAKSAVAGIDCLAVMALIAPIKSLGRRFFCGGGQAACKVKAR